MIGICHSCPFEHIHQTISPLPDENISGVKDPFLVGCYPNVTQSANTGVILEIRRERAVELMFEGHRFNDLQRWLLLSEAPYTEKYSHEFTRVHDEDWYKSNDPRDAEVVGFRKEKILERNFDTKHYWFPLPDSEVYLYEAFSQNPGW